MLCKTEARAIVDRLVAYTDHYAIVNIYDNGERVTRFANSEIIHNVDVEDLIIALTVHDGRAETTCSTNHYDEKSLRELALRADRTLSLMPAEEGFIGLGWHESEEVPESINDARLSEVFDVRGRVEMIKACVDTLDDDFTAAGIFSLHKNMHAVGTSDGRFLYHYADYVYFDTTVTHRGGATGYGDMTAINLDFCDIEGTFKLAYDKSKASRDPIYADVGPYTVILEPAAVDGLLRFIATGLSGDSYLDGTSFASGQLGKKCFGDNITLRDDVHNPLLIQCFFDAEGFKRKPLTLIRRGVVEAIAHDSRSSRKAGVQPKGHALGQVRGSSHPSSMIFYANGGYPLNLVMEGGDSSLEEMIASTEKGILVTHFHYMNYVDPVTAQVTGLTRDGTFLIEDGIIRQPIHNMRFTESMLNTFSKVTALSQQRKSFGRSLVPAIRALDFHFTSGQR